MNNFRWCGAALAVLVLLGQAGCPPGAAAGSFQIINAAPGVIITELYLAPSGSASQGPNRLAQPLGLGHSARVDFLPPGYYDELAVAVVVSQSDFVRLPNAQISIQAGQTYVHTVYWTSEDPAVGGPTLDDVIGMP